MKKWLAAGLLALLTQNAFALCLAPLCTCGVTATPLSFAPFNPLLGTLQRSSSTVRLNCNSTVGLLVPYTVALSTGSGSYTSRRMTSGARTLNYNLYTDSAYSTVWGDGTSGSAVLSGNVTLAALASFSLPFTLYGQIDAGQNTLVPGVYTDNLTVTLTYY